MLNKPKKKKKQNNMRLYRKRYIETVRVLKRKCVWHNLETENKNGVSEIWIHVYNTDVKLVVKWWSEHGLWRGWACSRGQKTQSVMLMLGFFSISLQMLGPFSHPHYDLPLTVKNTLLERYKTAPVWLIFSCLWHGWYSGNKNPWYC